MSADDPRVQGALMMHGVAIIGVLYCEFDQCALTDGKEAGWKTPFRAMCSSTSIGTLMLALRTEW